MNVWWLLTLLLFVPFVLFLGQYVLKNLETQLLTGSEAYLVLSSCLGNNFRARVSGFSISSQSGIYDKDYLRTMANSGSGMSGQIELQEMMHDTHDEDYEP